jgi:hypothetical protein
MPTFGNTNIESNSTGDWANYKYMDKFSIPENGSVSKLSFYCNNGSSAANIKGVIYADSSGVPGALKATGTAVSLSISQSASWVDLPFASAIDLTTADWWLGIIGDSGATTVFARVTYGSGFSRYNVDTYSDGPSDPAGTMTLDSAGRISIYATYTTGATFTGLTVTRILNG